MLENKTDSGISIMHNNAELKPEGSNSNLLNAGETGVYFTTENDLSKMKINSGYVCSVLSEKSCERGIIYSFRYENGSAKLVSKAALDPAVKKQVWTAESSTLNQS